MIRNTIQFWLDVIRPLTRRRADDLAAHFDALAAAIPDVAGDIPRTPPRERVEAERLRMRHTLITEQVRDRASDRIGEFGNCDFEAWTHELLWKGAE